MPAKNVDLREQILKQYAITPNYPSIAQALGISRLQVAYYGGKLGLPSIRASNVQPDGDNFICSKCSRSLPKDMFSNTGVGKHMMSYCKKCRKEQIRKNDFRSPESFLKERFRRVRQRSRAQGVPFTITYDQILELWENQKGLCFYTDERMLTTEARDNAFATTSFDKIIPSVGYVPGNVVLCSTRANAIKSSCTLEEMEEWLPTWYEKVKAFLN